MSLGLNSSRKRLSHAYPPALRGVRGTSTATVPLRPGDVVRVHPERAYRLNIQDEAFGFGGERVQEESHDKTRRIVQKGYRRHQQPLNPDSRAQEVRRRPGNFTIQECARSILQAECLRHSRVAQIDHALHRYRHAEDRALHGASYEAGSPVLSEMARELCQCDGTIAGEIQRRLAASVPAIGFGQAGEAKVEDAEW